MLQWLKGKTEDAGKAAAPVVDLEAIRALDVAVLFKHSRTCPVSWHAEKQVQRFQEAHPEVPVFTVTVQDQRALSNRIEAETGIDHESPQVIVFEKGEVVGTTSHGGVTAGYLARFAGAGK